MSITDQPTSVRKNPKPDTVTYTIRRDSEGHVTVETNPITNQGTALAALQSLAVITKASKCGVCGCTETFLMTKRTDSGSTTLFMRCSNPKCKATLFLQPAADNPFVLEFASGDNVNWFSQIGSAPKQTTTRAKKTAQASEPVQQPEQHIQIPVATSDIIPVDPAQDVDGCPDF